MPNRADVLYCKEISVFLRGNDLIYILKIKMYARDTEIWRFTSEIHRHVGLPDYLDKEAHRKECAKGYSLHELLELQSCLG